MLVAEIAEPKPALRVLDLYDLCTTQSSLHHVNMGLQMYATLQRMPRQLGTIAWAKVSRVGDPFLGGRSPPTLAAAQWPLLRTRITVIVHAQCVSRMPCF